MEQWQAVLTAQRGVNHALRVGHHAENIARIIEDAGNVVDRTVGVFAIAEGDTPFAFEPAQCFIIGKVVAVVVGYRHRNLLILTVALGENRIGIGDGERHGFADKEAALRMRTPGKSPASVKT